jgi:hypothetical protein
VCGGVSCVGGDVRVEGACACLREYVRERVRVYARMCVCARASVCGVRARDVFCLQKTKKFKHFQNQRYINSYNVFFGILKYRYVTTRS